AAIVDGVVDWISRRGDTAGDSRPIGLLSYLVLKRLDDMAYGLGLWSGVVRERNIGPLKPQIRT
ncbi:MAG TPA: mycofactocin system glycosyltransferase, partial [Mycobacterium sp.]|nr:mycofactocin system glycosyltransferase [Mycobacterium sp.]